MRDVERRDAFSGLIAELAVVEGDLCALLERENKQIHHCSAAGTDPHVWCLSFSLF